MTSRSARTCRPAGGSTSSRVSAGARADPDAWECLDEALRTGGEAELGLTYPTVEGDPIGLLATASPAGASRSTRTRRRTRTAAASGPTRSARHPSGSRATSTTSAAEIRWPAAAPAVSVTLPPPPTRHRGGPRMPTPSGHAADELAREQAHLAASREQLARMRERTAAMDSAAAGDWVSREYLESTFALRMKQLADDPTVPLFFGRVDYDDGEEFHIGRRHVSDPTGEPLVVDWRAPVSLPFYRASAAEPMGVGKRRRYGFQQGRLTAFEDEDLRGRARSGRGALGDPRGRDRAAARGPDARHRRHHPARAGRDRPLRAVAVGLRAGRPGHRQDGRRPAPRGVPPLRAPRAADPPGRAGGRAERELPALHPRRAAGPRRDRRDADHHRGARRDHARAAAAAERDPRADDAAVATLKGDARMAAVLRARAVVAGRRRRPRGSSCRAVRGGGGSRRTRSRSWWRRCARAGCGTARRGRWCRSRWRTGCW